MTSPKRVGLAGVGILPFVSQTTSKGVAATLTMDGVLLNGITATNDTAKLGFGYCDVHPNNSGNVSVAYNPYQTFTSANDFTSKTSGTGGGDPIDLAWAVDENGNPHSFGENEVVRYVRIYTGTAAMNGMFGEISTEVCGIAAVTGTSGNVNVTGKATVKLDSNTISSGGQEVSSTQRYIEQTVTAGSHIIDISTIASNALFVNGDKVDGRTHSITVNLVAGDEVAYQVITQTGTRQAYVEVIKLIAK